LPKTAVSQFELTIPEKGLEFTISPAAAYSAIQRSALLAGRLGSSVSG